MAHDFTELPLIVFDEVDDEPMTSSMTSSNLGQNENSASLISVASASEERIGQATVSVCGGRGDSQGCLEPSSTGRGEAPGGDKRMAEDLQGNDLDASGMEDMIQKILEKYGETEAQSSDAAMTPGRRTTSQDVTERRGAATREADSSVSDMIRRESSKWDKVYGSEDSHIPGPSRDWTGRQEVLGRRPVTVTEDTFKDVAIGSVIRSQTGVARQLISVSAGLDGINDDLEDMKRELKRIQTKDYTCLDGGNDLGGQTIKEFAPIGILKDAGISRRKNEWVQERESVVRFDDGNRMQETERCWKVHQPPTSYLPGAGRAHIKESDVNLTHLLTIAEPVEPYRQTRSLVDDGAVKRERQLSVDRFGTTTTQFTSVAESSSKHGSHRKPDGYCNLCEEFDGINTKRRSLPPYEEPSKVTHRSHNRTYQSTPAYEDPYKVTHRSHNHTYQSIPTYEEPSKVYKPLHQTYQSTSSYEDPYKVTNRSHNQAYQSTSSYEDPYKVTHRSHNQTYQSTSSYEDPYKVTNRSHRQTYQSTPAYEEPSKVVYRSRNHTYDSPTIADTDQNSLRRSREDLGGIYKTSSGIYFYSDDIRSYSDRATLDPDGSMRSFVRQASVPPRAFQSHSSSPYSDDIRSYSDRATLDPDWNMRSFVRQSSAPPRAFQSHSSSPVAVASQSRRSSGEFTSRFLTKVRSRRNSLGGRIDTDRYGSQTLKVY